MWEIYSILISASQKGTQCMRLLYCRVWEKSDICAALPLHCKEAPSLHKAPKLYYIFLYSNSSNLELSFFSFCGYFSSTLSLIFRGVNWDSNQVLFLYTKIQTWKFKFQSTLKEKIWKENGGGSGAKNIAGELSFLAWFYR